MLDSSKLKEFADDNFEFHENVRKFYKSLEIPPFPTVLSKSFTADA